MSYSSPRTGLRTWQVLVLFGLLILAVDVAATRTLATKSDQFRYAPAPPPVEEVEVLVAARDLPVGTVLARAELAGDEFVKTRKMPKGDLPPESVTDRAHLAGKLLVRAVRAGEPLRPGDVQPNLPLGLPPGTEILSLRFGFTDTVGFVVPGSKVNLNGTLRTGKKLTAIPVAANLLVVAVDVER